MRDWCQILVGRWENSWDFMGWSFYALSLTIPIYIALTSSVMAVYVAITLWALAAMAWVLWWVVDAVDRDVHWWAMALCFGVMSVATMLPLFVAQLILFAAPFIFYHFRLRDL